MDNLSTFAFMFKPSNPAIAVAGEEDIPHITRLLNSAYRGEKSRQGWTTEADLIAGEVRTDEANLQQVMSSEGSIMLKYLRLGSICGCVNLQKHGAKIYLGMLSVSPVRQNEGIGKALLIAAEEWATAMLCTSVYMTVISARTELIEWYRRHGYLPTGEKKPFPEDGLTGKHLQELEFIFLEKVLKVSAAHK